MGKSKNKSSSSSKSAPKCTCDHPYSCSCGNRPERPSRGHKWDPETQTWGGKGHKQKGASGQVSSVSAEAKTTSVGKTKIAQWQRLPSQLLDEVTKKEGRPRPKFKDISSSETKQKYRVIIQDAKATKRGTDHDLIFVPAAPCGNGEQAKEEAALLALLHMTPSLPHERKLPEPYKTTWLHAIKAAKEAKKSQNANRKASSSVAPSADTTGESSNNPRTTSAAQATTNLSMGRSFASKAEKRRQQEEKQKSRNARIRKHLAFLEANKDHQVFLSAKCRQQIETLLRGDAVRVQDLLTEDTDVEDDFEGEGGNDLKVYVLQRLHNEGFTKAQARTAFGQLASRPDDNVDEEQWDSVHDECLQWLCIHLNEDELPEGFDPRGRTLDVVVAPSSKSGTSKNGGDAAANGVSSVSEEAQSLANEYGITDVEASIVLKDTNSKECKQDLVWKSFCRVAEYEPIAATDSSDHERNVEVVQEEREALEAIFLPEDCSFDESEGYVTINVAMQTESGKSFKLEVVTKSGSYPASHPERILVSGDWKRTDGERLGTTVHLRLIKFMSEMPVGDPMIFELYNQSNTLLHSMEEGELSFTPLSLQTCDEKKTNKNNSVEEKKPSTSGPRTVPMPKKIRRPRQRGFFWSVPPKDTPAAVAFPKISPIIAKARKSLPAAKAREEFLSVMKQADENGRVLLLTGDTGCGKTLQIPQFLLENAPADVKIVVAQPRRLAATAVAARVAEERGESEPGKGSVGYVVRGDVAVCNSTRLLYCTTGVLLRQLQSERALDAITHIVVDEVHERHLDTDVLLGVLKECIQETPHLRVVLMSATLDADRFAAYWGKNTPRIHIPGRTFPVEDHMLEDVLSLTGYIPPKKGKKKYHFGGGGGRPKKSTPWDDSEKSDEEEEQAVGDSHQDTQGDKLSTGRSNAPDIPLDELVKRVDQSNVDYDMLGQLVKRLVQMKKSGDDGSILVFLPGAPEISKAMETIAKITRGISLQLLSLHGGLQPKDQNRVFQPAQRGYTKVILSTNVAETSITIPDCTIVIDSCREKQMSYDPSNRMPLLLEHFAAKDSLKQRRGRAGRVQAGTCYKLISKETFSKLPNHGEPEICRCALDQTLLSLLFLGVEDGTGSFLGKLLDSPSRESINAAILSLQRLGAVTYGTGVVSLTPLGMHLAGIPAPPTVGKILVMGSILGCRSATLAMAAGMSVGRSPFLRVDNRRQNPHQEETMEDMKRNNILEAREQLFKSVGNSDHAMLAAAFLKWDGIRTGGGDRRRYCESMGLSFNGMRDMKQLVRQLDSALASFGYAASSEADRNSKSWRIIRACAVAAMAPSQLVRVQRPKTKYTETAEGAVERDGVARELQFYVRCDREESPPDGEDQPRVYRRYHDIPEERVFFHPSSANFTTGNYHCPWLVFNELVRTSKAFLRDATECSAYSLLLFGGKLQVQAGKGVIVVDDWVRLAANARVGALIGGLRRRVDDLLAQKVLDPYFDIAGTVEMRLIVSLLVSDGLGE